MLQAENQQQVERFLAEHPDFELLDSSELLQSAKINLNTGRYLSLDSGLHGTDGFFAAAIQRKAA